MSIEEITGKSLSPRCMRCMLDKYLDACPDDTPWDVRADYLRRSCARWGRAPSP